MAILVACAFGGIAVFMVLNDLYLADKTKLDERMAEEFRNKQRERAKRTSLFRDLGNMASELQDDSPSFIDGYQTLIDQSGLEGWTLQKLAIFTVALAIPPAIFGFLVTGILGALGGALIGGYAPTSFLMFKRSGRLNALRAQLPDTFDLMSRVIRAGQTMPQAMAAVVDEFPAPISEEFALCTEMMNLGIAPEDALNDLARRSGVIELKIFVLGLLIQRETGGNLAEMLDNLSAVVRERFKINGQIAALTAEGRMQAIVLMCLPPGMLVIMIFLNPDYSQELINRPSLILGMLFCELMGWLWIRKIVNFDF
jgi:tight adherence protein B